MDHGAQWNCRLGAIEYGSTVVMITHPGLLGYSVKYCICEAKGEKAVKTGHSSVKHSDDATLNLNDYNPFPTTSTCDMSYPTYIRL